MTRKKKSAISKVMGLALAVFGALGFLLTLPYCTTIIYDFPEPTPFSGPFWYNPYTDVANLQRTKANFHAHGKAWGGLTNGAENDSTVMAAYVQRGYDIPGVSNYHKTLPFGLQRAPMVVPMYEHGFNVGKIHQVSIGAEEVSYFDFPLWQNASQRQQIIENQKRNGSLVALAHPKMGLGYRDNDFEKLCNYDFIEVHSSIHAAEKKWDKALSAGRLVWGLANDDTHSILEKRAFSNWNIIFAKDKTWPSAQNAITSGKSYGYYGQEPEKTFKFMSCEKENDTFSWTFDRPIDALYLLGQNGDTLHVWEKTASVSYTPQSKDTYLRLSANLGYNHLYLNPIVRTSVENQPPKNDLKPTQNKAQTWGYRICMILLAFGWLWLLRKATRFF